MYFENSVKVLYFSLGIFCTRSHECELLPNSLVTNMFSFIEIIQKRTFICGNYYICVMGLPICSLAVTHIFASMQRRFIALMGALSRSCRFMLCRMLPQYGWSTNSPSEVIIGSVDSGTVSVRCRFSDSAKRLDGSKMRSSDARLLDIMCSDS